MDLAALAAGLGGVFLIAEADRTGRELLGPVEEPLPERIVGPGEHGSGRSRANAAVALPHHLLAPELWQKDDGEVPDQPRHELLVEVSHQVADPLAKPSSGPVECLSPDERHRAPPTELCNSCPSL
ncbi:hypothetical protein QOT17_017617 [Balamuthia mandrillaris]